MQKNDIGQELHGTTWGEAINGKYSDYENGRFGWFKQAKFGIFIHWGVYSLLEGEWNGQEYRGIAEWIMRKLEIPVDQYEKIAEEFNPVNFDAKEWLDLFDEAGAQYVTITSKHHDGFCLFDSDVDDFNIVKKAAYGKDVIKAMSESCAEKGIRLCLYYSQDQDWHEPNGGGNDWDFKERSDDGRQLYVDRKVIPQLKELLSNYGPIGYFWFDTPGYLTKEQATQLKNAVISSQPECMSSSRLGHNLGDFESLPDQMVPNSISTNRCETAMTHNDSWAFSKFDHNWKSPETLIHQLVETVSCGANYLFNIGPKKDGSIPPESIAALKAIGAWLKVNGESIYSALPNPLETSLPWGVCTAKPGKIYAHIMEQPKDNKLVVPYTGKIDKAYFLADNEKTLNMVRYDDYLVIHLPENLPDPVVTVVVLETTKDASRYQYVMPNQTNVIQSLSFRVDDSETATIGPIRWMHEYFGNWHHRDLLRFSQTGAKACTQITSVTEGHYILSIEYNSKPVESDNNRHTLKGKDSLTPVDTECKKGILYVDKTAYEIELPFVTPGYFEEKEVCHQEIIIPEGLHRIKLEAASENFPEIVKLVLRAK